MDDPGGDSTSTKVADGDETTERVQDAIPDGSLRERAAWLWQTERSDVAFARELVIMLAIAVVIGLVLFAYTGVWPPFTAVSSDSMEPNMEKGDLILLMDTDRNVADAAVGDTGIVTHNRGEKVGHISFGKPGDVVVYIRNGEGQAIIHRARFYVEEGENWYDEADPEYVGTADNCEELNYCPAPHDGFITKGDNNARYDQVGARPISQPVKTEWIKARARHRVPYIGYVRLFFAGVLTVPVAAATVVGRQTGG